MLFDCASLSLFLGGDSLRKSNEINLSISMQTLVKFNLGGKLKSSNSLSDIGAIYSFFNIVYLILSLPIFVLIIFKGEPKLFRRSPSLLYKICTNAPPVPPSICAPKGMSIFYFLFLGRGITLVSPLPERIGDFWNVKIFTDFSNEPNFWLLGLRIYANIIR